MRPYKSGNNKVYAFAAQDCSSSGYRKNEDNGGEWEAIILEENVVLKTIYCETFDSGENAWIACENQFKKLYPNIPWEGR